MLRVTSSSAEPSTVVRYNADSNLLDHVSASEVVERKLDMLTMSGSNGCAFTDNCEMPELVRMSYVAVDSGSRERAWPWTEYDPQR